MKMSCQVIEDLLPLYCDEVCSEESKVLVDEHIDQCEKCKNILAKIMDDTENMQSNINDSAPIKSIRNKWAKSKRQSFIKGTIISLVICISLFGSYYGLTQWKCIPVPSELLEITEVFQLADGSITYHLNIKDTKDLSFIKFTYEEDGSFYMTPMRSVLEKDRVIDIGLYNTYDKISFEHIKSIAEFNDIDTEVTACYFGTKEDSILLWDKEMDLPKASEALEEMIESS